MAIRTSCLGLVRIFQNEDAEAVCVSCTGTDDISRNSFCRRETWVLDRYFDMRKWDIKKHDR